MATLLEKLRCAVHHGQIQQIFTTEDFKKWISNYKIINDDTGLDYSTTYIEGFLSSSTVNSTSTKSDKALKKLGTDPESYSF